MCVALGRRFFHGGSFFFMPLVLHHLKLEGGRCDVPALLAVLAGMTNQFQVTLPPWLLKLKLTKLLG